MSSSTDHIDATPTYPTTELLTNACSITQQQMIIPSPAVTLSQHPSATIPPPTITSSTVPVSPQIRQFIVTNYSVDPKSTMFVHPQQPERVYLLQGDVYYYVDLCCACVNDRMQHGNLTDCLSNNRMYETTNRFLNASEAAEDERARKLSGISTAAWHAMTDLERGAIQKERRKTNAFKTALCREFRDTGKCAYGSACRFAHGEIELRLPPQAHPKYKTQLCNKFALYGRCPYGARCQFIHRRPNETVAATTVQNRSQTVVLSGNQSQRARSRRDLNNGASNHSRNMTARGDMRISVNEYEGPESRRRVVQSNDVEKSIEFGETMTGVNLKKAFSSLNKSTIHAENRGKNVVESNVAMEATQNGSSTEIAHKASVRLSKHINSDQKSVADGVLEKLTENFDRWMLCESEDAFSRSCFPRIEIPSSTKPNQ